MSEIVVADSTCLIGLSKIGKLSILRQLFEKIFIPPAVFHEVVILGARRPGAEEVKNAGWIETCEAKNTLAVQIFRLTLGAGESEAIVLATERKTDLIILDDWKARQAAVALTLPVIGTIAVLKKAHEKGFLNDFQSTLDELRNAGFRFSLGATENNH
jgi:predicted nucleic acid-binding protein